MHKDFHLYATYMAAKEAGYSEDEATKIACAAQMVDEFGIPLIKKNITVTPMISQVIQSIFSNKKETEIENVWMPFHFIPKNKPNSNNEESRFKNYQCGYGDVIKQIINKMRNSSNTVSLEQIGIVMHVLADTFAHQEFCGVPCKNCDIITEVICYILSQQTKLKRTEYVPAHLPYQAYFGHGCVGHLPDLSWVQYEYTWESGDTNSRNNFMIFTDAYKTMLQELCTFKGNSFDEEKKNHVAAMGNYLGEKALEKQIECYNILMKNRAISDASELYQQELSALGPDLKGKAPTIQEKLKTIPYTYKQIIKKQNGIYVINDIKSTAFDLYNQPVTTKIFDEEFDNVFELKCANATTLKDAYETYKNEIHNKPEKGIYENFLSAAKAHKSLVDEVL